MTETTEAQSATTTTTVGETSTTTPAEQGLFSQVALYWRQLKTESVQQLQLFTLEAQLAAESLVAIWLLALSAALLLIGIWLLLHLALWQGLKASGLADWQALLLAFVVQLLLLTLCLWRIRYHSRFLRFNQTINSFMPSPATPKRQDS